jgi:alanyl-tRNA synthetase
MNTVSELRQAFLDYFKSKEHTIVSSSPLVPANDPTLLFTNAGMVQFKETFLGLEPRSYTKAASCQRCVRAGGKHNDLENVGYTARHHTFFEMLGNFSFGAYFKREAIQFAWEFLTEVVKLPPEKLWVTIYEQDDEAAAIWLNEMKIDPTRFSRCGEKDNFWAMGDTGPCGPCSEIFYDHGPTVAGGPPGSPEADGDRYVEIWNLVFMQYNRDGQGQLTPLPKPSVDTGMGLERLAAVMQGVHNNFEIDLFKNLVEQTALLFQTETLTKDKPNNSLRVIADHIRACAFLVLDGIVPSNEGRGYVLRRIIRRAIRHGHQLGGHDPFFYRLVEPLAQQMGQAYPELNKNKALVERILKQEEERFNETLDRGMRLLEQAIADLQDALIPGDIVFKLYDTYGFPIDLTADIARERHLKLDLEGFEQRMAVQRTLSSAAEQFKVDLSEQAEMTTCQSEFIGYEQVKKESTVIALFQEEKPVERLVIGQTGRVILEHTPFYAESGGQVGDKGILSLNQGKTTFEVQDTQKWGQAYLHLGKLTHGTLQIGDHLQAQIDEPARQATARNHSATHLLHAALRQILGEHVKQKGSLVEPERLRFDFAHFEPVTTEQLTHLERLVNEQILHNTPVQTRLMSLEDALDSGAMALFGEKYDQQVRVLSIGDFSTELCGGTHVRYAGDIGLFKIISETGTAAGIRRIEAITGTGALNWVIEMDQTLRNIANLLKIHPNSLKTRVAQLLEQNRNHEKEIARLQAKLASSQGSDLASQAQEINGIKVLAAKLENTDGKQLRNTLDQLKNKLGSAVIVLATVKENKIALVAGVTKDITHQINAGNLLTHVAKQVGGKGGGRPDMAQGGGNDPTKLPKALQSVTEWVKNQR